MSGKPNDTCRADGAGRPITFPAAAFSSAAASVERPAFGFGRDLARPAMYVLERSVDRQNSGEPGDDEIGEEHREEDHQTDGRRHMPLDFVSDEYRDRPADDDKNHVEDERLHGCPPALARRPQRDDTPLERSHGNKSDEYPSSSSFAIVTDASAENIFRSSV